MIERGEKNDTRWLMPGVFSRSTAPDLLVSGLKNVGLKEVVSISSSSSSEVSVSNDDDDKVDEEEAPLTRDGHEDEKVLEHQESLKAV
jgi:hypothetical protein